MKSTEHGLNTVISTSAGRLFDAVSAMLGICRQSSFEGEASCALEFAAEGWRKLHSDPEADPERFGGLCEEADGTVLETEKLVSAIVEERLAWADAGALALRFHAELARQIAEAVIRAGKAAGISKAALSGGVFQNRLLLELTVKRLRAAGLTVLLHSLTPPTTAASPWDRPSSRWQTPNWQSNTAQRR